MKDKNFQIFLILATIFFMLTLAIKLASWIISGNSPYLVESWFSDRFFTFQFSTVYLIGGAVIDRHYTSISCIRYNSRKEMITCQLLEYCFLAVVLTSIWTFLSGFSLFCVIKQGSFQEFGLLIDKYFRFILGLFIVGSISLNIRYLNYARINQKHHVYAYLLVFIELILLPNIRLLGGPRIPLIFFWLFTEKIMVSYSILLIFLSAFCCLLYKRIKKVDLLA